MPLYEYECDACSHRFETIQKFSDPLVDTCPRCGGHVRKLPSSPAIQFKGSGFYITDYPKKDQGGMSKSDKSEKSENSESKADAKTGSSGDAGDSQSSSSETMPAKTQTKTETKAT